MVEVITDDVKVQFDETTIKFLADQVQAIRNSLRDMTRDLNKQWIQKQPKMAPKDMTGADDRIQHLEVAQKHLTEALKHLPALP